jgi:hypothetical protein
VTLLRCALVSSLACASMLVVGDGRAESAAHAHAAVASSTEQTSAGATVVFPYQQRRLLYSRNAAGGLAYVTSGATRGASLPVVVFLHGMNPDEIVHPWFGPAYGDLRPVVESLVEAGTVTPFVLAAPTHTRYATGATVMWPRFDLDDFLDATEAALGATATLDRTRVVVVGHSGAGCNPSGGILAESLRRAKLLAVVDVDGCVDDTVLSPLAEIATSTPVRFFWQRTWARPMSELASACPACKLEESSELPPGASPHNAILPDALRRVLPELLPPSPRLPR